MRGSLPSVRIATTLAWLLPLTLLVGSIVSVPLMVLDEQGLPRYRALRAELAELRRETDQLRDDVRAQGREVEALRADPEAIERIARDELGMVREGEIVFQFPE